LLSDLSAHSGSLRFVSH